MIVLSHYQVRGVLEARRAGAGTATISPDLNRTAVEVTLEEDGVRFPTGEVLRWADAETIAAAENKCFLLEEGGLREIRVFSEVTQWVRSLYPTPGAPSMLVAGMVMHRVEGIDPYEDTLNKIRAAAPVTGIVLDTATGLGYTAIEAAKTAERVITVEIDPASLEIARLNPWSQDLFNHPKIQRIVGDVWEVVEGMAAGTFSVILHDPPTFRLAGELYSAEFYAELYRVLRPRGRLFHYIGDPASRSVQRVWRGVVQRLREVGFARVVAKPWAFGVVAYK